MFALTTMGRMIVDSGKLDEIDVSSVRCVVSGGERTLSSLFEALGIIFRMRENRNSSVKVIDLSIAFFRTKHRVDHGHPFGENRQNHLSHKNSS